jgi:hypothetical protein
MSKLRDIIYVNALNNLTADEYQNFLNAVSLDMTHSKLVEAAIKITRDYESETSEMKEKTLRRLVIVGAIDRLKTFEISQILRNKHLNDDQLYSLMIQFRRGDNT